MRRVKAFIWRKTITLNVWELYCFLSKESFPNVESWFVVELVHFEKHREHLCDRAPLDVTRSIFARVARLALRKGNLDLADKIVRVVEEHAPAR